jgi:hypothetical protein
VLDERQPDQDPDHDPAVAPADAPARRRGRVVVEGGQGQPAAGAVEQGVVHGQQDRLVRPEEPVHDQVAKQQAQMVRPPAGVGEEPVRSCVVPDPGQAGAGQHPGDGARSWLGEQPGAQGREGGEGGGREATTEAVKQGGEGAGYGQHEHRWLPSWRVMTADAVLSPQTSQPGVRLVPQADHCIGKRRRSCPPQGQERVDQG